MALVSRTFGGARTSDLHAWDWGHVDIVNWADAHVSRPKTKTKDRLARASGLPSTLRKRPGSPCTQQASVGLDPVGAAGRDDGSGRSMKRIAWRSRLRLQMATIWQLWARSMLAR